MSETMIKTELAYLSVLLNRVNVHYTLKILKNKSIDVQVGNQIYNFDRKGKLQDLDFNQVIEHLKGYYNEA